MKLPTLAAVVALGACGHPADPAPTDPTGKYEVYSNDNWMLSIAPGAPPPVAKMMTWRTSIEIRPDHTWRYEWQGLKDPKRRGATDGTWRLATGISGDIVFWILTPRGQPEVRAEGDAPPQRSVIWSRLTGWWVPVVDFETGSLSETATFRVERQRR